MNKQNRIMLVLATVRQELEKKGTEYALRFLTEQGYLRWCEGKKLIISDIKPETWQ